MNAITSGMGPSPLQIGSRGMDSAPAAAPAPSAAPFAAIDTQAHSGQGAMSGHTVAVGDGQTTKRMQEGGETKTLLAIASPAVGKMLAKGSEGTALKGRQVANGDGQGTSLLQKTGTALRGVLSGLSDMLKAVVDAIKGYRTITIDDGTFAANVTGLHDNLSAKGDDLFLCMPMNRWFPKLESTDSIPAPRGVHDQAVRDWSGEGVTINGKRYEGNVGGVNQAVEKLVALCDGNEASAEWISRFANQQALGQISIQAEKVELGPNKETGFMFTKGRPSYEMSSLGGGAIELTVRYAWNSKDGAVVQMKNMLDEAGKPIKDSNILEEEEVAELGQKFNFSYSLRFDLPQDGGSQACPDVSLSQPLQCRYK